MQIIDVFVTIWSVAIIIALAVCAFGPYLLGMTDRRNNTFASSFEKIEERLTRDIGKTLEAFGIE